jgi:hypothetical protein
LWTKVTKILLCIIGEENLKERDRKGLTQDEIDNGYRELHREAFELYCEEQSKQKEQRECSRDKVTIDSRRWRNSICMAVGLCCLHMLKPDASSQF